MKLGLPILLAGCLVVAAASAQPFSRSDFLRPDTLIRLPRVLGEISGLTVLPEGYLGAVQDENGVVYVLDSQTGQIVGRHRFGSNGDFEGLETVGRRLFVLRSDGRLFVADLEGADMKGDEEWPSRRSRKLLHAGCDSESLTFDLHSSSLWTACKEHPGRGLKRLRGFYRLDEDGDGFSATRNFTTNGSADQSTGYHLKRREFKPAGMAFLPNGEHLLVLSSVKPAMVLMDRMGRVLDSWRLPKDVLPQPEGIAIHPDGRLFVASEGPGRRGTLAIYTLNH